MCAANTGDNININLKAIGMFQNVADYTAKQHKQEANALDLAVSSSRN